MESPIIHKKISEKKPPYKGSAKRSHREGLVARRKYFLICSDILILAITIVTGWGLAEILKNLFFPGLQAMEWDRAITQTPPLFGLPAVFIILTSGFRGHYVRFRPFWDEFADLFKIVSLAAGLVIIYLYLTKSHFSRFWFVITWSLVVFMVPISRMLAKKAMMRAGFWFTPTVVIGSGANALESAEAVESDPLLGMKVIAILEPDAENTCFSSPYEQHCIGDQPEKILRNLGDPYVVLALEPQDYDRHTKLLGRLCRSQVNMSIVPPLRGVSLLGSEVSHVFRHEVLLLRVRNNLARRSPQMLKRVFDLFAASVLLLILSPVFAVFTWRISRDGGNVFFRHARVGRHGEPFACYKFRTMIPNAQEVLEETLASDEEARKEWDRDFKLKNDLRITPVGKFLRKTSLDELPQLWNVAKGEMSLVGPRPIVQEELERYGDQVNFYLEARPGMTGLWQISGRNNTDYERRVSLDAWYARNWSLWYDVVILLKTVPVVLNRKGAY